MGHFKKYNHGQMVWELVESPLATNLRLGCVANIKKLRFDLFFFCEMEMTAHARHKQVWRKHIIFEKINISKMCIGDQLY